MDSKNNENHIKKYDEKSLEKLQSRTIFADPNYGFVFKKTEKIIAAIYLVSNLISDTEPIKWQIRKMSLGLMSDMLSLRQKPSGQSRQIILDLLTTVTEISSLLKIASLTEQISSMNYSILHRELGALMSNIDGLQPEIIKGGSMMLSQDFFNVPAPAAPVVYPTMGNAFNFSSTAASAHKGQYRTENNIKDRSAQPTEKAQAIKDNRKDKILELLKAGKPLGIKDFAQQIKGCSEKTIQRELLSMVESGVLKRTGERRWSVYSLA